jgi:hypothetical protein
MTALPQQFTRIESLIRCDPARRGLLGGNGGATRLGLGQLAAAARHLSEHGRAVGIVTGFAIPTAAGPVAETDGPLGAVLLAATCAAVGITPHLITDEACGKCLREAARFAGLGSDNVEVSPLDAAAAVAWCDRWLEQTPELTHLIAVERVGPSHTRESLESQPRHGPPPVDQFEALVPPEFRDRCHNMRGEPIEQFTAPLHRLFERRTRGPLHTIGIGDGGNEIGMGAFPWEELYMLVASGHGARIVCRVPADWTIIAGTSNWSAYALAADLALLRGQPDVLRVWTERQQEELLTHIVRHGPAVDGVTRELEPTVDGLPFVTYIQPWSGIREVTTQDSSGMADRTGADFRRPR